MESLPFSLPMRTVSEMQKMSDAFASDSGCGSDDIACLRALTLDSVLTAQQKVRKDYWIDLNRPITFFLPFMPTIGATDVKMNVLDGFAHKSGSVSHIPLILGTCSQEGVMFVDSILTGNVSWATYDASVLALYGLSRYKTIMGQYKYTTPDKGLSLLSNLTTDSIFICSSRNASVTRSALADAPPVWEYSYSHGNQPSCCPLSSTLVPLRPPSYTLPPPSVLSFPDIAWGPDYSFCYNAVCHGAELVFVFRGGTPSKFNFTLEEEQLSIAMSSYWGSFVKWGDPNREGQAGRVFWPAVSLSGRGLQKASPALVLQTPEPVVDSSFASETCALWDREGYDWEGDGAH